MAKQSLVCAVVLNWNNYEDSKSCLESLHAASYPNLKVIVIDNGSSDSSGKRLRAEFDQCRFVFNEDNLGFSRGCNRGIRVALEEDECSYVLLLNNDAVVTPESINEAVRTAEADPRIGLVSGKVLFSQKQNTIWYAGGYIDRLRGQAIVRGFAEKDCGQYDSPCEVGFITGAMMLIKREVLETVGLLPEEYFFGVEEWDYSLSVRRAGFKLFYEPKCVAYHGADGSHWNYDPKFVYNAYRNKLIFQEKYLPRKLFPIWLKAFTLYGRFVARPARRQLIKAYRFDREKQVSLDDLDFALKRAVEDHGKTQLSKETLDAFDRELKFRRAQPAEVNL